MNTQRIFVSFILLLVAQLATANTVILPAGANQMNLLGQGGIMDNEFGLDNLMRVDDSRDQFWSFNPDDLSISVVVQHPGYTQNFGYINPDGSFTSLLPVPSSNGQNTVFSATDSERFRFGLDVAGPGIFSSVAPENIICEKKFCTDGMDHMVTWLITGGDYAGDYVVAWEDLNGPGKQDYNDLVVRISGISEVPLPAAIWLMPGGLASLMVFRRRKIS
jgi:hypothetical protein